VFVMAGGQLLTEGTPAEVVADPRVIDAYLGGAAA
jgi:branched-chain amino acid transport system ATP-binding protein